MLRCNTATMADLYISILQSSILTSVGFAKTHSLLSILLCIVRNPTMLNMSDPIVFKSVATPKCHEKLNELFWCRIVLFWFHGWKCMTQHKIFHAFSYLTTGLLLIPSMWRKWKIQQCPCFKWRIWSISSGPIQVGMAPDGYKYTNIIQKPWEVAVVLGRKW